MPPAAHDVANTAHHKTSFFYPHFSIRPLFPPKPFSFIRRSFSSEGSSGGGWAKKKNPCNPGKAL